MVPALEVARLRRRRRLQVIFSTPFSAVPTTHLKERTWPYSLPPCDSGLFPSGRQSALNLIFTLPRTPFAQVS